MEMTLFGDDYARMAQYVEVGLFLHVTGKTQNRWNSDQLEFKPTNIRYLSEIREKLCKELLITLDLACLSDALVMQVNELLKAHPGTCSLSMKVVDPTDGIAINLQSRTLRVSPANTLLNALRAMDGIQCKVA